MGEIEAEKGKIKINNWAINRIEAEKGIFFINNWAINRVVFWLGEKR